MKQYEYKFVSASHVKSMKELEEFFQDLGENGWQLCMKEGINYIFMREKQRSILELITFAGENNG